MTLSEFIEKYVCENTMIRLWVETHQGHFRLGPDSEEVCMEWSVLDGTSWGAAYANWRVVGVTDIFCETYREAVNIVITHPWITMEESK